MDQGKLLAKNRESNPFITFTPDAQFSNKTNELFLLNQSGDPMSRETQILPADMSCYSSHTNPPDLGMQNQKFEVANLKDCSLSEVSQLGQTVVIDDQVEKLGIARHAAAEDRHLRVPSCLLAQDQSIHFLVENLGSKPRARKEFERLDTTSLTTDEGADN